jgi:hypothetical protein
VKSSEFEIEALSRRVKSAKREVEPGNSETDPFSSRMESAGRRGEAAELEVDATAPNIVPAIHKLSLDGIEVGAGNYRAEAVEYEARLVSCDGVPVRREIVSVVHKICSGELRSRPGACAVP